MSKHQLFLMSAVVSADAAARGGLGAGLSLPKQARFNTMIDDLFPDVPADVRKKRIAKTIESLPPFRGGLAFLKQVERSSQKVAKDLGGRREAFGFLQQLGELASSDATVTDQEMLVLRAIATHSGLRGKVDIGRKDGRVRIRKR